MNLRFCTLPLLLLPALSAQAGVVLTWPGAGACSTTLQACIDSAPAGARIEIETSSEIDEDLTLDQSIELVAAKGYRPRLAPVRNIISLATPAAATTHRVRIAGIDLIEGRIELTESGAGNADFSIEDCRIHNVFTSGIQIHSANGGTLVATIRNNVVAAAPSALFAGVIHVQRWDSGSAELTIANNRISGLGPDHGAGIYLEAAWGGALQSRIHTNWLAGRFGRSAIFVSERSSGSPASHDTDIVGNVITEGARTHSGIGLTVTDGTIDAQVINNSVLDQNSAISFSTWEGATGIGVQNAEVHNNLLAHSVRGVFANPDYIPTVNADYNLLWDNDSNQYTAGPNDFSADPMLLGRGVPYVRAGSPTIDAANNTYYGLGVIFAGFPQTDAGGLLRTSSGGVDVGAIEFGTQMLTLTKTVSDGQRYFGFTDPLTDGNGTLLPQVSQIWNPYGTGSGVYNGAHAGVLYSGGFWWIDNQTDTPISQGASFGFLAPVAAGDNFMHTTSGANTLDGTTQINNSALNSQPNDLVLVTPHVNGGGGTLVYNPSPIAVGYSGPNWSVSTTDGSNMTIGLDLLIYSQAQSHNAFVAEAAPANSFSNWFYLDHPMLNGQPCARAFITARSDGTANPHPLGLWYDTEVQRWSIYNQDLAEMPEGARFNVLVESRETWLCSDVIFADGVDD